MGCPQHLRGQVTDPDDSAGPGPALPRPFMKKLSLVGATVGATRLKRKSKPPFLYTRAKQRSPRNRRGLLCCFKYPPVGSALYFEAWPPSRMKEARFLANFGYHRIPHDRHVHQLDQLSGRISSLSSRSSFHRTICARRSPKPGRTRQLARGLASDCLNSA
jgi:hypothetical protein